MSKVSRDVLSNYVGCLLSPLDSPNVRSAKYGLLCDMLDNMDLKHFNAVKLYAGGYMHWKEAQAPNLRQAFASCGVFELEAK